MKCIHLYTLSVLLYGTCFGVIQGTLTTQAYNVAWSEELHIAMHGVVTWLRSLVGNACLTSC